MRFLLFLDSFSSIPFPIESIHAYRYHDKPLDKLKVLVTGGAGFIGSHLVKYLLQHGAGGVRVLDNLLTGSKEKLASVWGHAKLEFVEGDIRNEQTCMQACEGVDVVLHQAALGSIPRSIARPAVTHEINATGFVNMLVAARDQGVKRFIFASSSSIYGDDPHLPKREDQVGRQLSPYAVSKYTNELYASVFSELFDMKIIGLRYFNVFGPQQSPKGPYAAVIPLFVNLMLQQKAPYIHGDGEQSRDFSYVENVVQGNIKAMLTENEQAFGQVFNVAGGRRHSVLTLFQTLKEVLAFKMEPQFSPARPGDVRHSHADISRAQQSLGYQPKVGFREGLLKTIEYYRSKADTL